MKHLFQNNYEKKKQVALFKYKTLVNKTLNIKWFYLIYTAQFEFL